MITFILVFYSKKLDETTAELKKMAIELENEKAKTDRLLHEMLPEKVANQLKAGKTVEAGSSTHVMSHVNVLWDSSIPFTHNNVFASTE